MATINIKCIYCFKYGITCKGKPNACDLGPKTKAKAGD